jgi:hypothetical protein
MTRIVLRPVASSLPLGFLAFGTGTILLTALELKWVPPAQGSALMVMVLAFVAPFQALAGVFAFLARDSGAATALTMLGAAWAAIALTVLRMPPGGTSISLGIFLLTLAAVMLVLSAGALRSKPLFGVLLMTGACRFALTGLYETGTSRSVTELASGWIGVPLVAFALYGRLGAAPGRRRPADRAAARAPWPGPHVAGGRPRAPDRAGRTRTGHPPAAVSWPGDRSRGHGRAVSHASDDELHAAGHQHLRSPSPSRSVATCSR